MGTETFPKNGQGHRMLGEQRRTKYAPDSAAPEYQQVGSSRMYNKGAKESMKSRRQSSASATSYAPDGAAPEYQQSGSSRNYPKKHSHLIKSTMANFKLIPPFSRRPKKA